MPRVPEIPLASVPRQSEVPKVAQPRDAGVAAETLKQDAQAVFQFGVMQKRSKDRKTLTTALGSLTKGLDEARIASLEAPPDEIVSTFEQMDDQLNEQIEAQFDDEDLLEEYRLRSISIRNSDLAAIRGKAFTLQRNEGRAAVASTLEQLSDSAASADMRLQIDILSRTGLDLIDDSLVYADSEKIELRAEFLKSVDAKRISRLINDGRTAGSLDESNGFFDRALALVDDRDATPGLDDDDRIAIRNTINTQRNAGTVERSDDLVLGVNRSVRRAETPTEIESARREVESLLSRGVLVQSQAVSLDAALDRKLEALESRVDSVDLVQGAINSGLPLDRKNRDHVKAIDSYYESVFLPSLAGLDVADAIEAEAELVGALDILPPRVEAELRRGANSDSPQLVSIAAQRYESLREASPQALDVFTDSERVMLENMAQAARLNLDPAESLKKERERLKLDKNVRTLRRERLNEERKQKPSIEYLESRRSDLPLRRPFRFDPEADFIPAQMEAAFAAAVERFYLLDPRLDEARRRAFDALSKVWGTTEVGAPGRRFMYMAPETMYPQFDGNSAEITSQLVSDVRAARPDLAEEGNLESRLVLTADSRSAREVDRGTSQLAPGYSVFLFDAEGLDMEQLFMSDGSPMRFFPDPGASEAIDKAKRAREDAIERAKSRRRAIRIAESSIEREETVREEAVGVFSFEVPRESSKDEKLIEDLQTRGLLTP